MVFHDLLLIVVESIERHGVWVRALREQRMYIICGVPPTEHRRAANQFASEERSHQNSLPKLTFVAGYNLFIDQGIADRLACRLVCPAHDDVSFLLLPFSLLIILEQEILEQ